jgi:short-subunit dehydrogenase
VIATARNPATLTDLPVAERLPLDVSDDGSVADAVAAAGAINVLVNNAGYGVRGAIELVPMDEVRRLFETNFFGSLRMMKAVLPQMRQRRSGTIVNVSSTSGMRVRPLYGYYAASKQALEAISEAVSYEAELVGVRVIVIQPGVVTTNFRSARVTVHGDEYPYDELGRAWDRLVVRNRSLESPPDVLGAGIVDAVENPDSPLRVPVGPEAMETVARLATATPDEFRASIWESFGITPPRPQRRKP